MLENLPGCCLHGPLEAQLAHPSLLPVAFLCAPLFAHLQRPSLRTDRSILVQVKKLNARSFVSGRIDFDAALKMGAIFNADASASNVAGDGAVFRDFDAAARVNIAN